MFRICDGKGFQITFANGNTVSVQWGSGNYCSNLRHIGVDSSDPFGAENAAKGSPDAEIAAFDSSGRWLIPTGDLRQTLGWGADDVHGWVGPDHVALFISWVAQGAPNAGLTMSERLEMEDEENE